MKHVRNLMKAFMVMGLMAICFLRGAVLMLEVARVVLMVSCRVFV